MADHGRRNRLNTPGSEAARFSEEPSGLGNTAKKQISADMEGAISSALRDGFARGVAGGGASPVKSFANALMAINTFFIFSI